MGTRFAGLSLLYAREAGSELIRTDGPITPGNFTGFIGAEGKPLEVLMQLAQLKSLMKGREGP